MLSEDFFSAVKGPALAAKTSAPKDLGIYHHTLHPAHAVRAGLKKSSAPPNCLAINRSHLFAAQADKAHVHVYSRRGLGGTLEALVPFPERVTCLTLVGELNLLALGTAGGRLVLWEICTGRQITTPACHVQAISCLASTSHHVLTGSDDSNVHVWRLAPLLDLESSAEVEGLEPDMSLTDHRGAITAVLVGGGHNRDTNLCVSASRDKSCVLWNYCTGESLRTLLFASPPLCACLDPCARALYVACDDSTIYLIDLFASDRPLLAPSTLALSSVASTLQVTSPLGITDKDTGPTTCLALSHDGTVLLSGHPRGKILRWDLSGTGGPATAELADLNAAVTNLIFLPLLPPSLQPPLSSVVVVKPMHTAAASRDYTLTARLDSDLEPRTTLDFALHTPGLPSDMLEAAVMSITPRPRQPLVTDDGDAELWDVIHEQRELQNLTLKKYIDLKSKTN